MSTNGALWILLAAAGILAVGPVAAEPWHAVEQLQLQEALERAPTLQTEALGEPARGVNIWERWMVPNPDGQSWDVLQVYFKEYYGPTWLHVIDLGTGQVTKQRLADGHQFYLSGRALGFDGKYYIATPSRKTWSMDLFVYDPATNTVEERGEIVHGLGGETRPLVTGPDGRIYGTGTRGNQVGLYIYDPKLGKVVKDFGPVGPSHPNGAWSRYVMGVDDTHAYIASGMIPAWYLVAVDLATGAQKVLLESPTERVMDIIESFPGTYARVPQDSGLPNKEYWLYHGQAIAKTNDTPPWPKQASPWDKAAPKPQVYFDQIDPDAAGNATLWYRSREDLPQARGAGVPPSNRGQDALATNGWKSVRLEGVESYPHRINPMSILPDGRLYGTGDDYAGVFVFDSRTNQTTILGPRPGLAPYTQIVCDGKLYSSGYSGGHLFVYDPARPWTLSKGGPPGHSAPDQADARSNPRYLGDFDKTTRVGLMHSSALGADGKIYFGGFGLRHYTGGGLGWYDPKTQKMDGFWKPLSGYAVQGIAPALDGRLIVISTSRAADELNGNRAPQEAKLFVYDVSAQKIVREIVPVAKGRTTGLIAEVRSGRLLGLTSNPAQAGRSILYGVDVATGAVLFTKDLPSPVSIDDHWPHWVDPSYEYNAFVRGPDGFVWTYLKDVLVRIDPKDASVHVAGKMNPVGWPAFIGNDVYFSGPEQLRRVRNLVPADASRTNAEPCLAAVRQFADQVLAHGRDTYGTPTPLFVDGLNVDTLEPVKWKWADGKEWVLCNLASQQGMFRTLDGLTRLTGEPRYKDAALEALRYAFDHLRYGTENNGGLLPWGGHLVYNATDDCLMGNPDGSGRVHELKCFFPHYELMWEANPQATRQLIENIWNGHVLDWARLDFNRHGSPKKLGPLWQNEYRGGEVFFDGKGLTFHNAGSDFYYAAGMLSGLSGRPEPLVWAERLAHRYVETRDPKTGLGGYQFSQCQDAWCDDVGKIRGDRAQYQYGEDFQGHRVVEGTLFPCYGDTPEVEPQVGLLLLGERLGDSGRAFTRWVVEELTAWGKSAYRQQDNTFIPMLTDGTSMEGYVCRKDGYFGPKGRVLRAGHPGPAHLWLYAWTYRLSRDAFLWEMARNIAQGNGWGDIGATPQAGPTLRLPNGAADPFLIMAMLELHRAGGNAVFLDQAQVIGRNLLKQRVYQGWFVPSARHVFCRLGNNEAQALLHLAAALLGKPESVPAFTGAVPFFHAEYGGQTSRSYDTSVIYNKTR